MSVNPWFCIIFFCNNITIVAIQTTLVWINQRSSIHSDEDLNFHVNNISGPQNTDSYLQLEEASFDDECSVEEVQKEDSSMK